MSFISTVPPEEASGEVESLYSRLQASYGYVPNYGQLFSLRPDLFKAWQSLVGAAAEGMDRRRYELTTVAAALARRNSYCSLAHGEKLLGLGSTSDEVTALAKSSTAAGLSAEEQAVFDFAAKVAADAASITEDDVGRLHELGLTDTEIFDVAAVAAARCFFTSLNDAMGTRPDAAYRESVPELVDVMAVGRQPDQ